MGNKRSYQDTQIHTHTQTQIQTHTHTHKQALKISDWSKKIRLKQKVTKILCALDRASQKFLNTEHISFGFPSNSCSIQQLERNNMVESKAPSFPVKFMIQFTANFQLVFTDWKVSPSVLHSWPEKHRCSISWSAHSMCFWSCQQLQFTSLEFASENLFKLLNLTMSLALRLSQEASIRFCTNSPQ